MIFSSISTSTPGMPATSGPGGDDDVLRLEFVCAAPRVVHDLDLAGPGDRSGAVHPVDLVLLEQEGDAVDVGLHRRVLVRHHRLEIEFRLADLDAERSETVTGLLEHFGGVQQRLGGNAADVEAGAAQRLALLDDRRLQAELRRLDGADITARSRSDHDDIIAHGSFPLNSGRLDLPAAQDAPRRGL